MNDYLDFSETIFFNVEFGAFYKAFWASIIITFLRYFSSIIFSCSALLFSKNYSIPYLRHKGATYGVRGVSVILSTHNTDRELIQTVLSLREQTIKKMQIILVNDGSSDMSEVFARKLLREKLIDHYIHLSVRGGKAAALNAGAELAKYDYTIFCDTGTTFHSDAIEIALGYFANPRVGAVSCGVSVRNGEQNLLTYLQKLHYFMSCLVSRNAMNFMGLQFVISGAFGAFRTPLLKSVGGHSPGTGEDLEITMRLARLGWKIEFSPFSVACTDVPETLPSLLKQTLRWDRDGVKIVYQKFAFHSINPFSSYFDLRMALAVLDNFIVGGLLASIMYIFIAYMFFVQGEGAFFFLLTVYMLAVVVELITTTFALMFVNTFERDWRYLAYAPVYVLLKQLFYEPLRFISIWSELVFRHSYADNFTPLKVQTVLGQKRK